MDASKLQRIANERRADAVTMITRAKTGHTGGAMSCLDALTCLFYHVMNENDHFLLSKGHSVEGYWAILADKGYFPKEQLKTFSCAGSPLIGHPNNKVPGVEMSTGALGHGLPVAVGMALAGKMDGRDYRVYTIMGDGELAEGSVWEGAMSGGNYQLDNLCALVDRNRLQISGSTEDVMKQDSQEERWAAFGWNVLSIPGNDVRAIDAALTFAAETCGKPTVIILNTVKGYGSPVMEDKAAWHHHLPNAEEYAQIRDELSLRKEALLHE